MTVAGQTISDEKLAEIIKGCEGVTPGPWMVRDHCVFTKEPGRCVARLDWHIRDERDDANAAHIARLDPQTVLSLLTELQRRREAEAGALKHALDRLELFLSTFGDMGERYDTQADIEDWRAALSLAASPSSPASGVRVKVLRDAMLDAIERQYASTPRPDYGDMINAVVAAFDAAALGEHP